MAGSLALAWRRKSSDGGKVRRSSSKAARLFSGVADTKGPPTYYMAQQPEAGTQALGMYARAAGIVNLSKQQLEHGDAIAALGEDFRAVCQQNLFQTQHVQAIFRAIAGHDDLITRLERFAVPAGHSGHEIWTVELAVPFFDGTVFLFYVDKNFDMGILEVEFRNGSFHGNQFRSVVARVAMMSEGARRNAEGKAGQ